MRSIAIVCALAGGAVARPGEVVRIEHHDPRTAPSVGPAFAPVTIELFIAPSNTTRTQTFRVLEQLQAEHPTRIRLVYRVLWRNENKASALAALEANAQGKFDEFLRALSDQKSNPDALALAGIADDIGMDRQKLTRALGIRTNATMLDVADTYSDVLLQVLDDNNNRYSRMMPHQPPPAVMINSKPLALGQLGAQQAREAYEQAYQAAQELLDRGVDPHALAQAFDREALGEATRADVKIVPDTPDTNPSVDGGGPNEHPLASPAIDVRGLPSYGSDKAPYQVIVLCNPISTSCRSAMDAGRSTQHVFPKEIRIVWAPFFDVGSDEAAALAQLGDAALCAEQIGALGEDDFSWREDSAGWHWVEEIRRETQRIRNRNKIDPDQLIDRVVAKLRIDSKAMSQCRARIAGTTFDRVAAARHAGVKLSPTVVLGGRIYGAGIKDPGQWQTLVETELGPGALGASVCAEPVRDGKEPSLDDRDCSLFRLFMFLGGSGRRTSTE